jgi:hypothetical protein
MVRRRQQKRKHKILIFKVVPYHLKREEEWPGQPSREGALLTIKFPTTSDSFLFDNKFTDQCEIENPWFSHF